MPRKGDGKLAAGADMTQKSFGNCPRSAFAAEEGHEDGVGDLRLPGQLQRLSVLQHQHQRLPQHRQPLQQLPLPAVKGQLTPVPALAAGDGIVTAHKDDRVALLRDINRLIQSIGDGLLPLPVQMGLSVHDSGASLGGDTAAAALPDCDLIPRKGLQFFVHRGHMELRDGGIATEPLDPGRGADEGDGRNALQRQHPVILQQDQGFSRRLQGKLTMLPAANYLLPGIFIRIGLIKKTQFKFDPQDSFCDVVQPLHGKSALLHQFDDGPLPELRAIVASLDIQTVFHGNADGILIRGDHPVGIFQSGNAPPVGAGVTLQPKSVLQNVFQIPLGAHKRISVHGVVADHHVIGAALPDARLEHRQIAAFHLPAACPGMGAVGTALRNAVDAIVLGLRHHRVGSGNIPLLLTPDDGCRHFGGKAGILTEGLLDPAPTGLSGHIQIRRQNLLHTQRPGLGANGPADPLRKLRVKGRAQIQGHGEDGSPEARDAVERLTGKDHRDAPAGRLHEVPLDLVEGSGGGIHVMNKSEAVGTKVGKQLLPIKVRIHLHGAIVLGRRLGCVFHAPEHAGLRRLFRQAHP